MMKVIRHGAREAVSKFLVKSGLWRAIRLITGKGRILVLGYHRVLPAAQASKPSNLQTLITSAESFRAHIETLGEWVQFLSMDQVVQALCGSFVPKGDCVAITFDDGYQDVFDHAFPILKEHQVPAALYVPTGHVGSNRPLAHDQLYGLLRALDGKRGNRANPVLQPCLELLLETLPQEGLKAAIALLENSLSEEDKRGVEYPQMANWDQLRQMATNGFTIGVHTVNHAALTPLTMAQAEREIGESKDIIESQIGGSAVHFSYPNGRYSNPLVSTLLRFGFQSAVTTEDRPNHPGDNPMLIGRSSIWEGTTAGLIGGAPKEVILCRILGVLDSLGLGNQFVQGSDCDAGRWGKDGTMSGNEPVGGDSSDSMASTLSTQWSRSGLSRGKVE